MNSDIKNLEPKELWKHFADLNAVPRASKKEAKVIAFMVDFAKKLNLETTVDQVGNVIIRKPATKSMANRKPVVMQSHLDMVHQKNNDTSFDFETQGIEMYIDEDWVKAKGTTLGADNGLGVATIMAILESKTIAHPDLEALFTVDEETGMTGAKGLRGGILKGEILLNLDTEEDDEIGVGCAGGIDVTALRSYQQEQVALNSTAVEIKVRGLQGGHSGMDIHKGLANANKLMNRILFEISKTVQIRISSIYGGGLRNAIPRESKAQVFILNSEVSKFKDIIQIVSSDIINEFKLIENSINIDYHLNHFEVQGVLPLDVQNQLLQAIYAAHNGVYKMSTVIPDLVETSNNLARVIVENGNIEIACLTRSSVESSKKDVVNHLKSCFNLMNSEVKLSGDYPGWTPNKDSEILKVLVAQYEKLNQGKQPRVAACHAGLECGILGQNYPKMDMISFGPNIKGAHSPDERVQISSVQKYWEFVIEILKQIPSA